MNKKKLTFSLLLASLLIAAFTGCPIPSESGQPEIILTHVPFYGSFIDEYLAGIVRGVNPLEYRVAVYLRIGPGAGWYNKPTWANPLTPIGPFSNWVCDVVTGGNDDWARAYATFLLPNGVKPPYCDNCYNLPEIPQAVALAQVSRGDGYVNWPPEISPSIPEIIGGIENQITIDLSEYKKDDLASGPEVYWQVNYEYYDELISLVEINGDLLTIFFTGLSQGSTTITIFLVDSDLLFDNQEVKISHPQS